MSSRPHIDLLSAAELKSLVLKLLDEGAQLRRTVAAQRDEIARLQGGPGRPHIKPSGMDQATEPKPPASGGERRRRASTRAKLVVHEEQTLEAAAPPGSRFKGDAGFLVQDLLIRAQVTHFRRECWQSPDRQTAMAPLAEHADRAFADRAAWSAQLEALGISARKSLPPRRRGSIPIPRSSPPRALCGAASRRMAFCPTP